MPIKTRLAVITTFLLAIVTWFLKEVISSFVVDKIVHEISPWTAYLLKYGPPAIFAAVCLALLYKRNNENFLGFPKKPELTLVVGDKGHYVGTQNFNIYNVMKSVLIGVKNTGGAYLTNCKVYFEVLNNNTNQLEKWLREDSFSLNLGEERYVGVAYYNEPLPPHPEGGNEIMLQAPPSGNYWQPPRMPKSGGAITIKVTSAEGVSAELILKLWVENNKLYWQKA